MHFGPSISLATEEVTSSFLAALCLNHANEKEKNICPTVAVSLVMQDMWSCVCLSSGSIDAAAGWRVASLIQLVPLEHTINLSLEHPYTSGFLLGLLRWIPFLDYANISPGASSKNCVFVQQHF